MDLDKTLISQTLKQQRNEIAELRCAVSAQAHAITRIKQILASVDIERDDVVDAVLKVAGRYKRLLMLCRNAQDLLEIYTEENNASNE